MNPVTSLVELRNTLKALTTLATRGMLDPDGHHKQWYLSQILKIANEEGYLHMQERGVSMGIPPTADDQLGRKKEP